MMKNLFTSLFFFLFATLFFNANAQNVWEPQAIGVLPANYSIADISIVNDQIIWATAIVWNVTPVPNDFETIVLKTTNGGANWDTVHIEEAIGRWCWVIHAFDENTACVTSNSRNGLNSEYGIYRTTDGGDTWTSVFSGQAGGGWIHFFDDLEGVAGFGQVATTNDGGMSWTIVTDIPPYLSGEGWGGSSQSNLIGTSCNSVWFGTDKGRVFKTEDRGDSWTANETGFGSNTFLYSFGFIDEKNGLGVYDTPGGAYLLARTTDGQSWESIGNADFIEVDAIPCSNTFIGMNYEANDERFAISSDHGNNWEVKDNTTPSFGAVFLNPEIGWMPGSADTAIYKWIGEPLNSRIYVNKNANGANNGSSWEDAYTDLQDALTADEDGDEIWVAQGIYTPDTMGGSDASTFLIDKNIKLYGGFSGTECNLCERDIEMHPTILSGDLDSNDVVDDFVTNREDNVMTVVRITSDVTNETVVDGFYIQNGHADGNNGANESGPGIYTTGTPIIQHCTFKQNFATNYGALALDFANNTSGNTVVRDCDFEKNIARAGGAISFFASSGLVENCEFRDNSATQWGGAIAPTADALPLGQSLEFRDCRFENNEAGNGGGAVHISLFGNNTNSNYRVYDCEFLTNASERGGGLDIYSPDTGNSPAFEIEGCTFFGNTASGYRSALSANLFGPEIEFLLKNCEFFQNINNDGESAAGISGFEESSGTVTVDSCIFDSNISLFCGLFLGNAGSSNVSYITTNSSFENNQGTEAGAIGLYAGAGGSHTDITVAKCKIANNVTTIRGGGITIWPEEEGMNVTISQTEIIGNESPLGAAIHASPFLSVFPASVNIQIDNSLIVGNISSQSAAIVVDSVRNFSLTNCTVANNQVSSGIQAGYQSHLILQNTILYNNGTTEFEALTNDVTVTSNGGNLIGDNSLDASGALLPSDQSDTAPDFDMDYFPTDGGNLVNRGNNDGVPEFDLAGNDRIQNSFVDIGAYESEFTTSAREVIVGEIGLSPNPATNFIQLQLPETITEPTDISLFDAQGRLVGQRTFSAGQAVPVGHLPSGFYTVRLADGERVYVGKFIKK